MEENGSTITETASSKTEFASRGEHTVFLFTDIVGSVKLQNSLGTEEYTRLLVRHTEVFKEVLADFADAEMAQDTGDGFLIKFKTASDAVRAALKLQYQLTHSDWPNLRPEVRIGLHQGQITLIDSDTDKGGKIVGMTINYAARVMDLADGKQILMTRAVFDDARQYVKEHPEIGSSERPVIEWEAHGRYVFKGADEPMEVFEVGAVGLAPLSPPADSEKAKRSVGPEEEETLGWRPGVGLEVPDRAGWILQEKLGVGGFGEVWLAEHRTLKSRRVFKFCFDVDRLRSLKREVTLFRLIREGLGDRPDITTIHEIHLESAPYFLELDYVKGGDLSDWAEEQGGIDKVPLEQRIEIVARIAETLAAAHSLGVVHKDIKPSNVLIKVDREGSIQPQLMDFGIGFLDDESKLQEFGITAAGFTGTELNANDSSRTGTRMYAPPETLAGKPHTIQGDVYAMGVFLYQMAIGDLTKPLAMGWQRDLENEILIQDVSECVEGDPAKRLQTADELKSRLQDFSQRWNEIRHNQERRRKIRYNLAVQAGLLSVTAMFVISVLGVSLFGRQIKQAFTSSTDAMAGRATSSDNFQDDMGSFTGVDDMGSFVDDKGGAGALGKSNSPTKIEQVDDQIDEKRRLLLSQFLPEVPPAPEKPLAESDLPTMIKQADEFAKANRDHYREIIARWEQVLRRAEGTTYVNDVRVSVSEWKKRYLEAETAAFAEFDARIEEKVNQKTPREALFVCKDFPENLRSEAANKHLAELLLKRLPSEFLEDLEQGKVPGVEGK